MTKARAKVLIHDQVFSQTSSLPVGPEDFLSCEMLTNCHSEAVVLYVLLGKLTFSICASGRCCENVVCRFMM